MYRVSHEIRLSRVEDSGLRELLNKNASTDTSLPGGAGTVRPVPLTLKYPKP